ncbi:hypothetical protein [Pelobacter propionicus]|uniref:hypothetical protein n=1 Tax=Pelobacter propionicus TaxID=29543 RepID=UPI00030E08C2|nr:hypothetical protein [Pelobacter propionicus]
MKILACVLMALLFGLSSCGRLESPTVGMRPSFHNASSNYWGYLETIRTSPAEIIPGETMLDVP